MTPQDNHTVPHSLNTVLADRILWYDGDSTISVEKIIDQIAAGKRVQYVDKITPNIVSYNRLVTADEEIKIKQSCIIPPVEWRIPTEFDQLDLISYASIEHTKLIAKYDLGDVDNRLIRLADEIIAYEQRGLVGLLRTLVYVINTLSKQNVVWGVGRGSSTASYLLFTLGVHDVDSYLYELNFADFMRD